MNVRKIEEKEYLSRYNTIQELDKEKDIKFAEFLGDKAMTEEDLDFLNKIRDEFKSTRLDGIKKISSERYQPSFGQNVEVEYDKLKNPELTFNDNKNDELKERKVKLNLFMKAGTKIIQEYRLLKRLKIIKEFLKDCHTKADVTKKVEESYQKSLEVGFSASTKVILVKFSLHLVWIFP